MQDSFNEKLAVYGRWTYRSAWALEITASLIGLATGIALGLQAFRASETADTADLILASAPFFMVALAELTKIPIATLLFSASWVWKPVLAVFLIALAGITFETVFMGLERSTTLRELQFKEIEKKLGDATREKIVLSDEMKNLIGHSALSDAQNNLEKATKLAEDERRNIESRIAQANKEVENGISLTPEAAQLRDDLARLEDKRKSLIDEQNRVAEIKQKQFESQRDSYVERLKSADASGDQKMKWQQELAALKNPVPAVFAEYKIKLDPIESDISQKRDRFESVRAAAADSGKSDERHQAETRRQELLNQRKNFDSKSAEQIDKARQSLSDAQSQESTRSDNITANNQKILELDKQIEDMENKRITQARKDQVQRLAGWVHGVQPEDVKIEDATRVGIIWFGSLAGLAALAGPMCAIVALGLQKIGSRQELPTRPSALSRILRRVLISWRWKRVRTVTIIKKIPVEKLIKEIMYIPLFTDDPEAVKNSLNASVPPEVARLVKVSMKGGDRGNKAQHSSS